MDVGLDFGGQNIVVAYIILGQIIIIIIIEMIFLISESIQDKLFSSTFLKFSPILVKKKRFR